MDLIILKVAIREKKKIYYSYKTPYREYCNNPISAADLSDIVAFNGDWTQFLLGFFLVEINFASQPVGDIRFLAAPWETGPLAGSRDTVRPLLGYTNTGWKSLCITRPSLTDYSDPASSISFFGIWEWRGRAVCGSAVLSCTVGGAEIILTLYKQNNNLID